MKDIVQLSRACKDMKNVTKKLMASEIFLAKKYQIRPIQVRRYLEVLSKYEGQEEIKINHSELEKTFPNVAFARIKEFRYFKEEPPEYLEGLTECLTRYIPLFPIDWSYYFKLQDYARLIVESEDNTIMRKIKFMSYSRKTQEETGVD